MILQAESGLNPTEYANMIAAFGDPIARVTLEQYSLSLTDQPGGGSGSANTSFDAIVVNDVIVRVWATANTITVEALASEDSGDESWSSQNLTATNIVTTVGLTLASSSNTVRVFWWDGTTIKYFESTDKGASWGAAQSVYAKSNVYLLAATSLTALHIISETTDTNYRFHIGEYNGSWSETDSDICWPFQPGSFDAIAVSATDDGAATTSDILAFSTDFPPMIQVGIENMEITRDYEQVRGIAIIRYQNGRWSNHYSLDVIDSLYEVSERENVRLSSYDDMLFLTYWRIDGDSDYSHSSVAVSRSATGVHWEQPYLLGGLTDPPAILIKRDAHAYILSAEDTWRSPSVGYTGDSRVTQDVSSRIISLTSRMGDIQEMQVAIANPDGVLDSTSPLDDDVAIQAIIEEGWVVGGAELLVQTAIVDIDSISQSLQIPTNHKILVGRDILARLLTTNADNVQEWESQQVSGDDYQGADDTKYSGMHHTAAILGHWETSDNTLELTSSKVPGVALHTGVSNAWNGTVRAKCKTFATDSADYAGVVYRAYDYENLFYAAYDADSDTVKLVQRLLNVDTLLAESSARGWDHNTFYGIQVDFRYNQVKVFTSTDFVQYLTLLTYTGQGVSVPGSTWGDIPIMAGAMGYLGFGFSEVETGGWPPVLPPPPWPEDPIVYPSTVSDWPNEMYLGTWEMGVYYTADMTGPDDETQPTWFPVNAGLPSSLDGGDIRYYVRQLMLDPVTPRDVQYCLMGDSTSGEDLYRRSYGGTWEPILTQAQAANLGIGAPDGKLYWVAVNNDPSTAYQGHVYVLFADVVFGGSLYVIKSSDYGDTWEATEKLRDTGAFYRVGNMVANGDRWRVAWNGFGSAGRISYSTNAGADWTRSNSLGSSIWTPWLSVSILDTAQIYLNSNVLQVTEMNIGRYTPLEDERLQILPYIGSDDGGAISSELYDDYHLGPERSDAFWHSASTYNYARVLRDDKLYVTVVGWHHPSVNPVNDLTPSEIDPGPFGAIRAPIEDDEDKIFLGRETVNFALPGHIYTMDGDTVTDPVDKSGKDPENDLTVVSIPWLGLGVCFEGIQPVIWL